MSSSNNSSSTDNPKILKKRPTLFLNEHRNKNKVNNKYKKKIYIYNYLDIDKCIRPNFSRRNKIICSI